jgi:hypothetical protein
MDALAFWTIEMSTKWREIEPARIPVMQARVNLTSDAWSGVIRQVFASFDWTTNAKLKGASKTWIESIALFAAPESGLSTGAANSILAGYRPELKQRTVLDILRQRRLVDAGIDENEAAKILAAIDKDAAAISHPWLSAFAGK